LRSRSYAVGSWSTIVRQNDHVTRVHRGLVPRDRSYKVIPYVTWRDLVKRPFSGKAGELPPLPPVDEEFSRLFPNLWAMMSETQWDDGSPRVPSTMYWYMEDGAWVLVFNDKDMRLVSFRRGDTFNDVLLALECALREDRVDWRRDKKDAGRGRR
jgi:hypothetical protein